MSDTPTPRTDALLEQWDYSPVVSVFIKHADQLERELAEATAKARTAEAMIQMCERQLGNALVVGQGALIDKIANVMRAGRAQSEALAEARRVGMAWALAAQRCGLFRADVPHSTPEEWESAQLSAACGMLDQLTAHKAALEKCEKALSATWADLDHLNHWMPTPCRELYMESKLEISKLKGNQ